MFSKIRAIRREKAIRDVSELPLLSEADVRVIRSALQIAEAHHIKNNAWPAAEACQRLLVELDPHR